MRSGLFTVLIHLHDTGGKSCGTDVYVHKNFSSYEKVRVSPVHTMKVYIGSEGVGSLILNPGTRSRELQ